MQNSREYAKSKGAILFAKNTPDIDYVWIASQSAKLIERHLGIPVTVVSPPPSETNLRFSTEKNSFVAWNNRGRYSAFDDSPYDVTLLLDSDYLILDDRLKLPMNTVQDYLIVRNNSTIPQSTGIQTMGMYSLPISWATAVIFTRSDKSRLLFKMVERVQQNYGYYRSLYNIAESNFRNDYAFTIADHVLSGYAEDTRTQLPWPMVTVQDSIKDIEIEKNRLVLRFDDRALVIPRQSIHVMGKRYLQSKEFERFVSESCS